MFFSTISQPKKFICKPFWYFFHWSKWQISLPSNILQRVKSRYFHIPEAWNRHPFRAEPSLMGNYRKYPRGPLCQCVTGTPSWPNCNSTSSTCNLPGRECVLFPMKNVSPSGVVMKGLGLRSLTQAGFPRVLLRSRFAQHVYKFLYVNTEVALNFPFSIGRNTLQLRPFFRSCSNFQIVLLTIIGRGSWKLHTDVCCK